MMTSRSARRFFLFQLLFVIPDVEELTQTIVNEYIKKIVVYAPDKSSGKRKQKVKIFFNFVDDVDIPVISEPIVTQTTYEHRKTA